MPQPRKKPRQQRACATWDAILEAAAQLFGEQGYVATTTNKIAERAGVSIGSLYQYFPNKDALLVALAEQHLEDTAAELQKTFAELHRLQPELEQTVRRLVEATVALHAHDPQMHRLLFDLTPRTPETAARLRELEGRLSVAVAVHLQRLGVAGPWPQVRALLLVQGIEAQVHGAVLAPTSGVSTQGLIDELVHLWCAALAGAPRGAG